MNHRYKIIASKNELLYHFASLEFKLENRELVYIVEMNYKKNFVQYNDFETGQSQTEKGMDHFSFHKDGTVHLVYKDKKNKSKHRDRRNVGKNLFDIQDTNYAPLLIHSVFFNSDLELCPKVETVDNQSLVFVVNDLEKFSIVLFSLGKGVDYRWMLNSHGFESIFFSNKSKFLVEPFLNHSDDSIVERIQNGIFVDTSILLGFTEKVIKIPKEIENKNIAVKGAYSFNVLPSDKKILSLS